MTKKIIFLLLAILVVGILLSVTNQGLAYIVYGKYSDWLMSAFDVDTQYIPFITTILVVLSIPFFYALRRFAFKGKISVTTIAFIVFSCLVGILMISEYGDEVYFTNKGEFRKCYLITETEGIKIMSALKVGETCPNDKTYNTPYEPISEKVVPNLLAYQRGVRTKELSVELAMKQGLVDTTSGKVKLWFDKTDGEYLLYDAPGFDKYSQKPLLPATGDAGKELFNYLKDQIFIIEKIQEQERIEAEAEAERQRLEQEEQLRVDKEKQRLEQEQLLIAQRKSKALEEQRQLEEKQKVELAIKQEKISSLLVAADTSARNGDLFKAKFHLDELTEIDPSNSRAKALFSTWELHDICKGCGVVTNIEKLTMESKENYTRSGSEFGNQFSRSSGGDSTDRQIAQLIGAVVGGTVNQMLKKSTWVVQARMDDGSSQEFLMEKKPNDLSEGQRFKFY